MKDADPIKFRESLNRLLARAFAPTGVVALACVWAVSFLPFTPSHLRSSPPPTLAPARTLAPQLPSTPKSPTRIISLVPSVTEMLFAMGAGSDVVGVSSFDHYPPEATTRRKVGGLIDPDFELILSLHPDLVIAYGTQGDLRARLERARVPMFAYEHAGLADITRTIRQLGARIGRAQAGEKLAADIEGKLADLRARTSKAVKPKTMLIFEREAGTLRGMYASGAMGFLHDMLDVAGGTNAFSDVKRQSLQVTAEQVLARAPDVILEIHSGPEWTPERIASERSVWGGLSSVPAVRTGRIHILVDEMISIPGPRVADATLAIARVLHPELFGNR